MILRWQTKHQLINNDRLIYDGTALGMLVRALVVILTLVCLPGIPMGILLAVALPILPHSCRPQFCRIIIRSDQLDLSVFLYFILPS